MEARVPTLRTAAIHFAVALAIAAGCVVLASQGTGRQLDGAATIGLAFGSLLVGLMVWIPTLRPAVVPVGAALLGFATGLAWTSAWLYWRFVEPQTAPGSNPLYGYNSLVQETIRAVLTPLRVVLILAVMALAPPFGGRRARWIAAALAAVFIFLLLQPLPELYRTWRDYPQSYEWGFGLIILGILLVLSAPALAAVLWRLRGRAWPRLKTEASAPAASPPT